MIDSHREKEELLQGGVGPGSSLIKRKKKCQGKGKLQTYKHHGTEIYQGKRGMSGGGLQTPTRFGSKEGK